MTAPSTNLNATGRRVYDAIDREIRAEIGRRVPVGISADEAHAIARVATTSVGPVLASIIAEIQAREPREAVGEALFDAAHEHCDSEGCTGGGAPWCDRVAARLVDPYGPLAAVAVERGMQDDKWGEQNHPDGTGRPGDVEAAAQARAACKANGPAEDNWRDILDEEVREAFAETDPEKLRAELIQVAAVAVNWVECIARRAESAVTS